VDVARLRGAADGFFRGAPAAPAALLILFLARARRICCPLMRRRSLRRCQTHLIHIEALPHEVGGGVDLVLALTFAHRASLETPTGRRWGEAACVSWQRVCRGGL